MSIFIVILRFYSVDDERIGGRERGASFDVLLGRFVCLVYFLLSFEIPIWDV